MSEKVNFVRGEGVIAGVAAGAAKEFDIDVILIRIGWIVAVCLGVGVLAYVVCWVAFPKSSDPTLGNRKRILGVCHRIAMRSGQSVGLIRLAAILLLFLSGGTAILGYIVAHFILPSVNPASIETHFSSGLKS